MTAMNRYLATILASARRVVQRVTGWPQVILGPDSERILAARYGFDDWNITIGGDSIKAYVSEMNGMSIEAVLEEVTAGGDTTDAWAAVGLTRKQPFTLSGPYNDAAGGPDAKFAGSAIGSTVAVVITWGGSKTTTVSAIVQSYTRTAARGTLTKYEATLQPTGTVTEA